MPSYPDTTTVTVDVALAALQAQSDLIDQATECADLWQSLSAAASSAAEASDPDWPAVKALALVANACSMMLNGDSTNAPFRPFAEFAHGRSTIAEDFESDDLALFSAISKVVEHKGLRARLADVAWVGGKPKNVDDARRAIDTYLQELPTQENWTTALVEWRRAVTLCMQLRKGGQGRLEKIEQDLERLTDAELQQESGLGRALAKLLLERGLGEAGGTRFAESLAAQGQALLAPNHDSWTARRSFDLAARWFTRMGNVERASDMTVAIAVSFEADADLKIATDPHTGHLVARSLLEDAIHTLRKVPSDQRPSRSVEALLHRMSRRVTESGRLAVRSMPSVKTGTTDITQIVEMSVQAVGGKEPLQALIAFADLHQGANLARMTRYAEQSLRQFSFGRLFGSSHIASDGRVIAKTPAGSVDTASDGHDEEIFGKIMQHYGLDINLVCQGQIVPAWRTLVHEHTIGTGDFAELMSLAPIVPPGRADQFAKGIWEGFEGDFSSAIYLLAPQVEHLARWHLKQIGAKTTTLDKGGIENEVGLSTLVDMPELKDVLGENTVFEMQALFCTPLGPNLRNEVAHGLLDADGGRSVATVYAWWWILRLALKSFVHARATADWSAVSDSDEKTPASAPADQPGPLPSSPPT